MDTPKKGNGPIVIIFLLIIVIVGFFVYKNSMTKAPVKNTSAQKEVPSAVAVDTDLTAIDANTASLTQDSANIDAGLNDTPIAQPE